MGVPTLKNSTTRAVRMLTGVLAVLLLVAGPVAPVRAASSWDPTLLVNTESFSTIDDGDSTTDIELRFGATLGEKFYYNRSETRFQLTRGLYIQGNLTATGSLNVSGATVLDGATTINSTLDTTGAITTDENLTINEDNGAADAVLTFGNDAGAETLKFSDTTNQFEFSDDVSVTGNMTVSGGMQVGNYAPGTETGAGVIRWNGTDFEGYDGQGWTSFSRGGKFIGVTASSTQGSFSTGSLVGYQAANELCDEAFSGSHMCRSAEIISTVDQDISAFTDIENGWVAQGPPGYTADSNDCHGWTSANSSYLGAWWEFSTSGGGQGFLTNCAVSQPIACCR